MRLCGGVAASVVMLSIQVAVVSAEPQLHEQLFMCARGERPTLRISACSAVIESGVYAEKELAWAFNNRGLAHRANGDTDRALADYDEAIRRSPQYASAFNNRCWARMIANRDLPKALLDCNESLRLRPGERGTLNSRAIVELKLGDFPKAIADFTAAIDQDAKDAHSLYGRGVAKKRSGDLAGSRADISTAVLIRSDIAKEYANLGVIP